MRLLKNLLSINLKKTNCSNCNEPQSTIRKPKSLKEALWGGWTCKKCNSKLDKFGIERNEK